MGIADSNSTPGRPGLVDQSQFARANQAIQTACSNLTNPAVTQQQVRVIVRDVIVASVLTINTTYTLVDPSANYACCVVECLLVAAAEWDRYRAVSNPFSFLWLLY